MKYEYLKGNEKAFDGEDDRVVVLFSVDNKDGIFRSVNPSNDDFPKGWNLIAERRAITEPVWDGEGLPPVGVECEVKTSCRAPYGWVKCKIVFSDEKSGVAFVYEEKHSLDCVGASRPDFFRPTRSPEDVARDEAIEAMRDVVLASDQSLTCYESLYDAIAAGKIPGIKLEDK